MAHHELKIEQAYFNAVRNGIKTFEIRNNDRGFQAGDTVLLKETQPVPAFPYTGRELLATIGYVIGYAQKENYVVFSLLNVKDKK